MKKNIIHLTIICALLFLTNGLFAQQGAQGKYFTSFGGVKIYYEVKGNGYPVILIHGFSGTGQGWKTCPLYKDLLNAGFMVIILDQRETGIQISPITKALMPTMLKPKI